MSNQKDAAKAERIRQELWKTFVYEIEELLESMEQQLLELEGNYSNDDLIAGLFRTMHTVKGTCGMMGLSKVESFTHKAEDLLDSVRDGKAQMSSGILDILFSVADILKNASGEIIAQKSDEMFNAPIEIVQQLQVLLNEINNISPVLEAHLSNTNKPQESPLEDDFDMFDQMVTETNEALDELEKTCLAIESNYENKKLINDLFRCVHSLKGNLNLAGMRLATQLLHSVEDMIGRVRDGHSQLIRGHIDILLQVADFMRQHFQSMSQKVTDITVDSSVSEIYKNLENIESEDNVKKQTLVDTSSANNQENLINMVQGDGQVEVDDEYFSAYSELLKDRLTHLVNKLKNNQISGSELQDIVDDLIHAGNVLKADIVNLVLQRALDNFFKDKNVHQYVQVLDDIISYFESGATDFYSLNINLESIADTDNHEQSSLSVEVFFEGLWKKLSLMRKTLDSLAHNTLSAFDVLDKIEDLDCYFRQVKELEVTDLINNLKSFVSASTDQPKNHEQASKTLQHIYTICWDLEDEVNEHDKVITIIPKSENSNGIKISSKENKNVESKIMSQALDIEDAELNNITIESGFHDFNFSGTISNKIDIAVDPLFVLDFIAEARENIMDLEKEIASLNIQSRECEKLNFQKLIQYIDDIIFAATNVEVLSVKELCENQINEIKNSSTNFNIGRLNAFVVDLYRLMVQVQDSIPESVQRRHHSDLNLSHVFKQWHSEQCLISAPWLVRTLGSIEQRIEEVNGDKILLQKIHDDFVEKLPEISKKIESYLFAAQFYKLSTTEKAMLSYRDFVVRIGFDIKLMSPEAIAILIELIKSSANLITRVSTEGEASEGEVYSLAERLVKVSEPNINSSFLANARKFLLSGELPNSLESCLDETTLEKVAEALKRERNIYLLHVDVDHDDDLADNTFELMNSGSFETLMSATDYIEDRSVFNCLLTSDLDVSTLSDKLKLIDSSQKYLYLKSLSVPLNSHLDEFVSYVKPIEFQQEHLENLNESIAELVAAKSTVDQIAVGIGEDDLYDQINILVQNHGSWDAARFAVQKVLRKVDDERKSLMQAQDHFSDILYKVQYGLRQLQEVNIEIICEEISKVIKNDAYFNAEMEYKLDDQDLLIEFQHKVAVQETVIGIVRLMHEITTADKDCDILSCNIVMTVGEHLEDLIFRVQWSASITHYFKQRESSWNQFCIQLNEIIYQKHVHEDRSLSFSDKCTHVDIKIKRHLDLLDSIVVRVLHDYYVIPTQLVQRIVNAADAEEVKGSAMEESSMVKVDDQLYPVAVITEGQDKALHSADQKVPKIVLLLQQDKKVCSLIVDELLGMQQVVLSPLHDELRSNDRLQSCVVLGKDRIGFVLKSTAVFG